MSQHHKDICNKCWENINGCNCMKKSDDEYYEEDKQISKELEMIIFLEELEAITIDKNVADKIKTFLIEKKIWELK